MKYKFGKTSLSKLIKMLKRHEGSEKNNDRHVLYKCTADKWTCGYGRNCEDNGFSEDEVELMLQNDIAQAAKDVKSIFLGFDGFSENRQNALIDMMFNLGITRFLGFKKMIIAIKNGNWQEAARQASDSKWHNQVGARALEIERLLEGG